MKPFAEILAKKTSGELVSPTRQPDLGPFSTNAVVRKNLLRTLMLFQSASLAKEEKIQMVTKRMKWGLGAEGVDEDSVYPTA